jgi:hypothetical protein
MVRTVLSCCFLALTVACNAISDHGGNDKGGTQCTPACDNKACGDDSCGGSCGACVEGTACDAGFCIGEVAPTSWTCDPSYYGGGAEDGCDCDCGAYDPDCRITGTDVYNCEGTENATCSAHGTCVEAPCTCDGIACGMNACGEECGGCGDNELCEENECVACSCDGAVCGTDRCGNSCGECAGNDICNPAGACIPPPPPSWTCDVEYWGILDGCDCECGALDPDCGLEGQDLYGCGEVTYPNPQCGGATGVCEPSCSCDGAACGDDGCGNSCGECGAEEVCYELECAPRPPAGWECSPYAYNDGDACHCGCGTRDADCEDPEAYVTGCEESGILNPRCNAAATCEPSCSCDGATCGDDGCGNSCGTCGDNEACENFRCVIPMPEDFTCGALGWNDGWFCDCNCGPSQDPDCAAGLPVYDCEEGQVCSNGACAAP